MPGKRTSGGAVKDRARDTPMTPAERRVVAQQIAADRRATAKKTRQEWGSLSAEEKLRRTGSFKQASRVSRQVSDTDAAKQAQRKRKAKMLLALEKKVNAGEMTNLEARDKMQRAGLLPGGSSAKALKGPGGFAAKAIGNIAEDALYTPAGLYQVGKAAVYDTDDLIRKRDVTPERLGKVAKDTAVGTYETVRHPLRRPGSTLLVGAGLAAGGAGAASRVSAAGAAAKAGGIRSALTRPGYKGGSLLSKPVPGLRLVKTDKGDTIRLGRYSSSPLVRGGQKAVDRARAGKAGMSEYGASRKLGTELSQERKVIDAVERAPAAALAAKGRRLTAPQQMALRVVEEQTPIDKQIAKHTMDMQRAKSKQARDRLAYRVHLLEAAKMYVVEDADGNPQLAESFKTPRRKNLRRGATPAEMVDVQQRVRAVSGDTPGGRERVLKDIGMLSDDSAEYRRSAPRRLVEGGRYRSEREANRMAAERERSATGEAKMLERQAKKDAREAYRAEIAARGERSKAEREWFRLATTRGPQERALLSLHKSLVRRKGELDQAVSAGQLRQVQREVDVPRSKEDVEARIAEIDKVVQPRIRNLMKDARGLGMQSTLYRNRKRGPAGGGEWVPRYKRGKEAFGEGHVRYSDDAPTDSVGGGRSFDDHFYRKLYSSLDKYLKDNPGPSPLRDFANLLDERAELKTLLQENVDPDVVFGDKPAPGYGTKREVQTIEELAEVDPAEHSKVIQDLAETQDALRAAEAAREAVVAEAKGKHRVYDEMAQDAEVRKWAAKQRLSDAPRAALERGRDEADAIRETGGSIVGAEEFRGMGTSRIPDVPEVRRPQPFGIATWRGGAARKPGSVTHGYSGALRATGNYRVKSTQLVAESGLEAQRVAGVERLRARVLRVAREERPADTATTKWVPVRLKRNLPDKDRKALEAIGKRAEEGLDITPEERRIAQSLYDRVTTEAFPRLEDLETDHGGVIGVGEKVEGVEWVPARVLDQVNKHIGSGKTHAPLEAYDFFSTLVKTGIIVAKPAYVVANTVGNLAFNLVQQGLFLPRNWHLAKRLVKDTDVAVGIDGIMGNGALSAFFDTSGVGKFARTMHTATDKLSVVTDLMFRRSAFVHEARRFGYKSTADFKRLLQDAGERENLVEISNRAKAAIVDYDRMGPIERDIVRRAVFIYPWVKGAALYAGNFLLEHPVQAGVYTAVAQQGREQAMKDLGPVPGYAEGSFKVGGSKDYPLTVNPATVSPLSQAAELIRTGESFASGRGGASESIGQMVSPLIEAAISAGFKRDLFTGASLRGSFPELFAKQIEESLAPSVLARGLARAETNETQGADRTYPMSRQQVVQRFAFGSFMPRTTNREQLNEAAAEDQRAGWSPAKRAAAKVYEERTTLWKAIREHDPKVLEDGKLPKPIRQAYNREAAVAAKRKEIDERYPPGLMRERVKLVEEARLAEKWGAVAKGTAIELEKRAAASMSPTEIRSWRDRLRYVAFNSAYGDVTSRARKYLAAHESSARAE